MLTDLHNFAYEKGSFGNNQIRIGNVIFIIIQLSLREIDRKANYMKKKY